MRKRENLKTTVKGNYNFENAIFCLKSHAADF